MKNDAWFKIEMLAFRMSEERRRRIMRTTKRNYFVLAGLAIIAFVMLGLVIPQSATPQVPLDFGMAKPVAASAEELVSEDLDEVQPENDPWENFNEKMFRFNRQVDRFFLKPIATGYDRVLPNPVQIGVKNAIDNVDVVRRLVNNVLQLKFGGAGRELARFTINSTIGVAGLIDVAKLGFGIEESDEDTGQTLGVYGVEPGPYLVLPFSPPMTVRDGFGYLVDRALNPLLYVSIFVDGGGPVSPGVFTLNAINERSLNLGKFEAIERDTVDLYAAVRDGYLQSRAASIQK